ncbi:hypothetical protein [Nocardioides flavescens]|uniref:Excreted virulence factor EspC, type VII ESX diderm n=1 Tax=Nocardioides flavescens TaxID=2691959 RepID=A0A6L7F298_9ACTN|nr:hypothetical protein [Nocardioides flavescens]MXG91311.1 hypothetical protein [Nocardioides flavescens]
MSEMRVEFEALTKAADREVEAKGKVDGLVSDHGSATLEKGALGKLPSSDEIQASFDEVYAKAGEALEQLGKACDGLADRLISFRDYTRDLDDTVNQKFTTMKGGA